MKSIISAKEDYRKELGICLTVYNYNYKQLVVDNLFLPYFSDIMKENRFKGAVFMSEDIVILPHQQNTSLSSNFSSLNQNLITPEFFLSHYWQFLPRYISDGFPSEDTFQQYCYNINYFLNWCTLNQWNPLATTDYQMRMYVEFLRNHNYSPDSIKIKMSAIKAFFYTALKMGFIEENPCSDIKTKKSFTSDENFLFYSKEQLQQICDYIMKEDVKEEFERYRNMLMFYLMGVEGFRNVEVHRLCDEDIDLARGTILVRGKGHQGIVYPCEDTIAIYRLYISTRPLPTKFGGLTPTIISNAKHGCHSRISRNGIRYIMNKILVGCNLKYQGKTCHILRHSCGTNLYAQTKDLRLVQEQLRHSTPTMTSKYAHVYDRMNNRKTSDIAPKVF